MGIGQSVTCLSQGKSQELFWPEVKMSKEEFKPLYDYYADRHENELFTALVRHEGLTEDGCPLNAVLIEIVVQ